MDAQTDLAMVYLSNVTDLFKYYKSLGEKAMAQLSDDELHIQYGEDANTIAIIVQHLSGNMLSRWTDFLTTDGEKTWRHRDTEFEENALTRVQVSERWEKGWSCLFQTLTSFTSEDLLKTITIRQQAQNVTEAINRQLAHYAYHVGQMVYIAKTIRGAAWQSLSIPKGNHRSIRRVVS